MPIGNAGSGGQGKLTWNTSAPALKKVAPLQAGISFEQAAGVLYPNQGKELQKAAAMTNAPGCRTSLNSQQVEGAKGVRPGQGMKREVVKGPGLGNEGNLGNGGAQEKVWPIIYRSGKNYAKEILNPPKLNTHERLFDVLNGIQEIEGRRGPDGQLSQDLNERLWKLRQEENQLWWEHGDHYINSGTYEDVYPYEGYGRDRYEQTRIRREMNERFDQTGVWGPSGLPRRF